MHIINGPFSLGALHELLETQNEETRNTFVPGDIALLAERSAERQKRNMAFAAGDIVQLRNPKGLGFRNTGPFVVIRYLAQVAVVHETHQSWADQTYAHVESDIILGMIMRDDRSNQSVYREIYAWSGMLAPYEMDETERQMLEMGKIHAQEDPDRLRHPAANDEQKPGTKPIPAVAKQSRWGTPPAA